MSKYPLSSLPSNRRCRLWRTVCQEYPCEHTPCHDPDILEELEEYYQNHEFRHNLWKAYHSLSDPSKLATTKARFSTEEWARFEEKFDRCRRIQAKSAQIKKDFNNGERKYHLAFLIPKPREWEEGKTLEEKIEYMKERGYTLITRRFPPHLADLYEGHLFWERTETVIQNELRWKREMEIRKFLNSKE